MLRKTLYFADRNSAVNSFVVVLPALPVIATTLAPDRRRTSRARSCKRPRRVVHLDQERRSRRLFGSTGSRHHTRRARRERPRDEVVAVEPSALDRHEQVAGGERPRIDRHALEPTVRIARDQPSAGDGRDLRRGQRDRLHPLDHSRAAAAARQRRACHLHVVERQRPIADHLVLLVSLAGDERPGRPRSRVLNRLLDRLPPIDDRERRRDLAGRAARTRSAGITMPRLISSMIFSGSSLRGLSEVTITRSLSRAATAPISGRLVRSRSPPQPKTVMIRPGRQRPRGLEQILQRVVGVRVVDDDADVVAAIRRPSGSARARARATAMPASIAANGRSSAIAAADCREDVVGVGPPDQARTRRATCRAACARRRSARRARTCSGPGRTSAAASMA